MLFDHCLAVQTWSLEFASPSNKIQKTLVWICSIGLNLLFYNESVLLTLASVVSKPVKIDMTTMNVGRGEVRWGLCEDQPYKTHGGEGGSSRALVLSAV